MSASVANAEEEEWTVPAVDPKKEVQCHSVQYHVYYINCNIDLNLNLYALA